MVNLLLEGTRTATDLAYSTAWKHWVHWCNRRDEDPLSNDLVKILEFLAHLFHSGRAYSTINVTRSALSATLDPINNISIGRHPLVQRFMRAVYNLNPPRPRYNGTWDVNKVLCFLQRQGPNEGLNLMALSPKLAILLALATFMRTSEIAAIDKSSVRFDESGVSFNLAKPRKSQKAGACQSFVIKRLADQLLCPISCLGHYVYTTDYLRTDANSSLLFISPVRPHKQVSANTISRWIKKILSQAGVGTEFAAHSTRGAASSKAVASGIPIDSILKRGNWSHESTFTRFYRRRAPSPSLEEAIFER